MIVRRLLDRYNKGLSRSIYRCDVCGIEGRWTDGWKAYGSVLDVEYDTAAHLCSDTCRSEFDRRLEAGEVKLPRWSLSSDDPNGRMTRKPQGYGRWANTGTKSQRS